MPTRDIYRIYINHFRNAANTADVDTETLLYSVPISDSENALNDPIVKTEMGKTGSFEFGLHAFHPYYNAWYQMKTMMRVEYDGTTIFRGRVLTIDKTPMSGERKLHLEGDLAFLMDSQQPAVKDDGKRPTISILQYLQQIINNHNSQMDESDDPIRNEKKIYLGEVPGQYTNVTNESQRIHADDRAYGTASWETSMQSLESLQKEFGGFFRTRYENGTCYLDWLDYCFRYDINTQDIQIADNLVNLTSTSEVNNIFTVLIPVGSNGGNDVYIDGYQEEIHGQNKWIRVPDIVQIYGDQLNSGYHTRSDYENAIRQYGLIYKPQSFPNADTKEKLWNYATDWIKNNYMGGVSSFDMTALDMNHVDGQVEKYLAGDRARVYYRDIQPGNTSGVSDLVSKILTIIQVQYHLHSPDSNNYALGIPNSVIDKEYGKKKSQKKASTKIGETNNETKGNIDLAKASYKELNEYAWQLVVNDKCNNKVYKELKEHISDPQKLDVAINVAAMNISSGLRANQDTDISLRNKRQIRSMLINGIDNEVTLAGPINPAWNFGTYTDEEIEAFNNYNVKMTLDGLTGSIGMKATMDILKPDPREVFKKRPPNLLEMNVDNGNQSMIKTWTSKKLEDLGVDPTTFLDGAKGALNGMKATLGLTGSGTTQTITQDGTTASIDMTSLANAGSTDIDDIVLSLLGGSGEGDPEAPDGQIKAGKNDSHEWRVKLNEPVTYTDEDNVEHVLQPGFVVSEDFAIQNGIKSVPSFYTKLAIVDTLIANKVDAQEISAKMAYLDKLMSSTIYADTSVRSDWIRANHFRGDEYILNVQGSSSHPSGAAYLGNCFASFLIYPGIGDDEGKIFFNFTSIDGTVTQTQNFKIADTKTYKDAVSAAQTTGQNAVKINKGTWTNTGGITFQKSAGTSDTKGIQLKKVDGGWSGTEHKTYIYDEYDDPSNPTYTNVTVTANASSKLYAATGDHKFTSNGTKNPPNNYFGFSSVEISVPSSEPSLYDATGDNKFTSNGTKNPPSGYDGFSKVEIDVPSSGATLYDATGNHKFTTNGTKNPPSGYDGFSKVEIDVPKADVESSDITIGSYNNVSTEPSGTLASTMRDTILAAIRNGNWFRFKVSVQGTTAEKYYKMNFGS